MIATLEGEVSEKLGDIVIVNVGGVGYGILTPSEDFGALSPGNPCKLYIYEHIREDGHDLFGFRTYFTMRLFEQLLSVNGVGPKMALNILSVGPIDRLKSAIAGSDSVFLQSASGVGKRLAERIVVDLRDKIGPVSSTSINGVLSGEDNEDEAVQALVSLGYSPQDASQALKDVEKNASTEERVRMALKERVAK